MRSMVEGAHHLHGDPRHYACQIFHDIAGADAENAVSAFFDVAVPNLISLWPLAIIMSTAINFNHKPGTRNVEIRGVGSDGMLPENFETELLTTNLTP